MRRRVLLAVDAPAPTLPAARLGFFIVEANGQAQTDRTLEVYWYREGDAPHR